MMAYAKTMASMLSEQLQRIMRLIWHRVKVNGALGNYHGDGGFAEVTPPKRRSIIASLTTTM